MSKAGKKVYVKTYGCQMNIYDSERITDVLQKEGFGETSEIENADLIVLNTCHIREKAAEKVYSELGRLRQLKSERLADGKQTRIAVAGCVAQAEGHEITQRAPIVDFVVGPQSYHQLGQMLQRADAGHQHIVETEFPGAEKFEVHKKRQLKRRSTAFLTVQEGCDKFCTFCVVPYTRGAEFSRSFSEILEEAGQLIDSGVREITLLGQNVNAYHGDMANGRQGTLARLIYALAELPGLDRLRYTTSHPKDMTDDLIAAHGEIDKLMPYLHLPFQAGSDRILAAMNRKHTARDYRKIIDRIRDARPDIALSTDIIVGFPDESDEEFRETLDMVRDVNFAQAYSFKYSARPGTPAANILAQVPERIKSERLQELQQILNQQQFEFNESCVDKTLPVLFDRAGKTEGQIVGRSPYLQSVVAEGQIEQIGELLNVQIQSAGPNSLTGVITSESVEDNRVPVTV